MCGVGKALRTVLTAFYDAYGDVWFMCGVVPLLVRMPVRVSYEFCTMSDAYATYVAPPL